MKLSHFFIDRPVFATVLSLFITIVGGIAYFALPIARYPEIAPPTIVVTATYPGASAEVVSQTVATPLEQQINGVENMLFMSSQATGDGKLNVTVTFKLGTDLDTAQVLTQNRVAVALPRLPEEVQRLGVTTKKNSPDMLLVVHLSSPDGSHDQLYLSNYATLQVKDVLSRLEGVGDVQIFGGARLRHADLARSRQGRRPQPDGGGGRGRPAGAERAGLRRRAQPAADAVARRLPAQRPDAGAADRSGAVRQHHHQVRRARAASPACATSAARSWARRTTAPTATSTRGRRCRC